MPRKVAIVVGGAACVWDEIHWTHKLLAPLELEVETLVINDMITLYLGPVDHVVTLHPEKLDSWLARCGEYGIELEASIWSHVKPQGSRVTNTLPENSYGSSGLFACRVAEELGIERVILCGVPMTRAGGHAVRGIPWADADLFWRAWLRERSTLAARVRSWSGRTRDILGEPTTEWVTGE